MNSEFFQALKCSPLGPVTLGIARPLKSSGCSESFRKNFDPEKPEKGTYDSLGEDTKNQNVFWGNSSISSDKDYIGCQRLNQVKYVIIHK